MADVTDMLKAELGVKSDKPEHHHQHHHDKIIVPSTEAIQDVTHALQSQLHQGKEVDREIRQEKKEAKG